MLRFANVVMSNPAKPDLPPLELKALITGDDFGLAIGKKIVERLGLEEIDMRGVREAGKKSEILVPYVGPVRISCGGRDVYTGAMNCIQGIAIGAQLARELGIDGDSQLGSGFGQGLLPFLTKTYAAAADTPGEFPPEKLSKEELKKYILVKEGVFDQAACEWICKFAKDRKEKKAGVEAVEKSVMPDADQYPKRIDHARDCFTISTFRLEPWLGQAFVKLYTDHVMPFYGVKIESWERPQLLSYEQGGRYDPHCDGEIAVRRPGAPKIWRRIHHRDVSIILYLNDDFTGGDLRFPELEMTIRPKPGLLVAFPSTVDYMHGAEPTESGDRLVMVTWAAIEGTPRMHDEGKDHVYMKDFFNKTE